MKGIFIVLIEFSILLLMLQTIYAQIDNATKIRVSILFMYSDKDGNILRISNSTKTVGTIEDALKLTGAGLTGRESGKSMIMTDNSTQLVDGNEAQVVIEKELRDLVNKPGAPQLISLNSWWGCVVRGPCHYVTVITGES